MKYRNKDIDWNFWRDVAIGSVALIVILTVAWIALTHIEYRMVSGRVTGSHYSPGYWSTIYIESCTTVGKTEICTNVPHQTYNPASYSLTVFSEDYSWNCSVDDVQYHSALETLQTTCEGSRWK
jgi:hypothetical protein